MSVVAAALTKFAALPGVGSTKCYFGEAPQADATGAQARPPYVVLKADPSRFEAVGANTVLETTPLAFEVYADTLAAADAIADVIRWGGAGEMGGGGFVYGTITPATGTLNLVRPAGETYRVAGLGLSAQRVHCVTLRYDVEVKLGTN